MQLTYCKCKLRHTGNLAVYPGNSLAHTDRTLNLYNLSGQLQRISRNHLLLELGIIDACKICSLTLPLILTVNQTAAPLRRQLKQNENRMRTIAQIKDAAAVHAKLKPVHDTFMKKNFKLTKDAYAVQHKEELDTFNKAVRTLMKLNGSTAVDFSALDAEFSALQSSSAELRTQLETLQPDISALKNIRKYIDMMLNKQQLSAPGGKTPEKESVLKKLNDSKAALEQKKLQPQQKATEHTL